MINSASQWPRIQVLFYTSSYTAMLGLHGWVLLKTGASGKTPGKGFANWSEASLG